MVMTADKFDADEYFMRKAIEQAKLANTFMEVPVGAVIVKDGTILSVGYNRREIDNQTLAHAEMSAIQAACTALKSWRLVDCDLYVTLEPCPMCAGAIINSRIRKLVYGAYDKKAGCAASVINLFELPFNHAPEVKGGVLEEECSVLLSKFFIKLRNSP